MTFNAGAIEAELTLNRRPFQEELAKAKKDAQDFARGKYTASVGLDSARLKADLDRLKARLDLATRDREVKIKVKTDEAEASLARVAKKTDETEKKLGLLRTAVELLGPPLVPLAGGLVAISTAAIGLGTSGITAFLGIRNEMKANTQVGLEYKSLLTSLKAPLDDISKTSALAVQPGVTQAVSKLKAEVPQLNVFLGQSSTILGDIVSHLTGGIVGGFRAFSPLMLDVEHGVDHIATRFETWATGSGGERFAKTLATDYQAAVPALKSLGELVVHLVSALNGSGSITMLKVITGLVDVIDSFPIGLLQAMVTAYTAWRITVAVTAGLEAARTALLGLAAAEAVAGAAGGAGAGAGAVGGLRGTLAGGLALAAPYAAAVIGVAFATEAAASATKKWVDSTSALKSGVGTVLDVITHPFSAISTYNSDTSAQRSNKEALNTRNQLSSLITYATTGRDPISGGLGSTNPAADALKQAAKDYGVTEQQIGEALTNTALWKQGKGPWADKTPAQINANPAFNAANQYNDNTQLYRQQSAQNLAQIAAQQASTRGYNLQQTASQQYYASRNINAGGLTAAPAVLTSLSKGYADATAAESKYLGLGAKYTVTVAGQKVAASTFNAVLTEQKSIYGDNQKAINAAIGVVGGHVQALKDDKQAAADAQTQQDNINAALTIAQAKYGLSAQQANVYAQVLGILPASLASGTTSLTAWDAELAINAKNLANANTSVSDWITAVNTFDSTADTAASRAQLMSAAMVALQGPTLAYANAGVAAAKANQQLVDDFEKIKKGAFNAKTGILDIHNAASGPVLGDLAQLQSSAAGFAAAIYQNEVGTKGQAQAAADATKTFYADTHDALVKEHGALGITQTAADKLAKTYFNWPKDATTQIEQLGGDNVQGILSAILTDLDAFTGNHSAILDIQMSANDQAVLNKLSAITGGGTSTVNGKQTKFSADGNIFTSFAGGSENHIAQIGQPGAIRVWNEPETEGEAYIPFAASKRARSRLIASSTVRRLGGIAFFDNGGEQGGFIVNNDKKAKKKGTSSSSSTTKYDTLLSAIIAEMTRLAGASKLTAGQISSLVSTMETSAKTTQSYGLITTKALQSFITDGTRLTAVATALGNAEAKLKTDTASYNALIKSDQANVVGGFDIGTSGNGYAGGILTTLQNKVSDASKFKTEEAQAQKLGLGNDFLKTLLSEGPTTAGANLQAILSEAAKNPAYIGQLNAAHVQLSQLGGALGTADANLTYGATLAADRATIAKDTKAQLDATIQLHKDLVAIEVAVNKKVHS